jgi:alpha-L-fucosidase 2
VSWEQSVLFQEAMKKAGVPCEFITIEGGGHGMGGWRDEGMQHYKGEMVAWLKKTLQQ